MGNGDNFALDWIRGELESTLDQARAALESYAEGGREETRLRSCLTNLHQVHGTLRMLELEGVVLLADHMEQTAQSLLNGSIQDARSAEQALMQSILQLPAFIEEVQGGVTEDLPLVMPYVNDLRSCCGLAAMAMTPQVSAEFTSEQAAEAMRRFRGINGSDKATRVRAAYQQVLLSVLKGSASAQTVETLCKIAVGMQRICEGTPLVTLWKSLEYFAKGYSSDPQKMSSEAIRDLRRVDAEMKKVAARGAEVLVEPLPVELVRDLLRAAEARGERDDEISELRSSVQTPQASQLKPREALDQAAEVLGEEIAAVRDHFDLFARSDTKSLADLKELTAPLDSVCSTLGMLGDNHGADLLRAQRALVLSLNEDSEVTEDVILGIAGTLVQIEQALAGSGDIASGDDALASAALNDAQVAVLQEARTGIDQVKQNIVDFVSSKWNTGYLEDAPNVLTAVQGALAMIPLPRAAQLLSQCTGYVDDQLLKGHHPDWQELDAFADALGGIDYFLERLFETGRVPDDQALDLTQESLERLFGGDASNPGAEDVPELEESQSPSDGESGDTALTAMLGAKPEELSFQEDAGDDVSEESEFDLVALQDSEDDDTDSAPDGGLESEEQLAAETTAAADLTTEPSAPAAESEISPVAGVAAAATVAAVALSVDTESDTSSEDQDEPELAETQAPAVDPEIVEVFVEEVDEVLETIEAELPHWSADLSAVAPITEIRRSFHTLKGSGRIVGANQIGELGWALENMLNRLMDGTLSPSEDHLFVVSHACQIIPQLRADFAQGQSSEQPQLIELLEQVDVLASGGVLSRALSSDQSLPTATVDADVEANVDADVDEEEFPIWDDGGLSDAADAADEDIDLPVVSDVAEEGMRPPAVDVPSFFADTDIESSASAADELPPGDSWALFVDELQEHLDVLGNRIRDSLADDQLELDSPFTRALHTIAGSSATAGEFAIVGIAEPLQDVSSAVLRERGGVLDGENLAFVREGVYALQRLLDIDAPRDLAESDDDSEMFSTEAQRLLGTLHEGPEASTSLLEMDDTAVLLDAREYLDGWRFGALDLEKAEQMNRALVTVIERAHSDDFAELAEVLHTAHNQFGDQPLDEEQHFALVAAHEDLLAQLDGLAAGQVTTLSLESRERLQDLMSQAAPEFSPPAQQPEEEVLDDDAQEALAYTLDNSDAFDLDTLDDDVFASDDATPVDDVDPVDDVVPVDDVSLVDEAIPVEDSEAGAAPSLALAVGIAAAGATVAASVQNIDDGADKSPEAIEEEEADPELLAIFFEEADELLEEFDHNLQRWSEERSNSAPLENLLRGLHTLKGGARLAGLSSLGDMTHDYESVLIEFQNGETEVSDQQFESIQQNYDDLVEAVARARDPQAEQSQDTLIESVSAEDVLANESLTDEAPIELDEAPAEIDAFVDLDGNQENSAVDDVADAETTDPEVVDDFAVDVAAAFSVDAVADMDAETQREQELRAAANEAAVAKSSLDNAEIDEVEVEEVEPAVASLAASSTNELDTSEPKAFQATEQKRSPESSTDDERARSAQEMVRVSAGLLEDLVNLAGESSIVRARVEQGISDFGGALEEMETTIERVREQLRRLEIETETRVSSRLERSTGPAYEDFDPLEMDRYSQLQQLTRSLTESATDMMDLKETLRYRARESETLLLQQARLNTELQEGLMRTRMVPFSRLMPRLRRIVRQVSRDLGKQVEFQAYNAEGELDRNVLERMVPPLEHMLRNAIDHGIEDEELRHSFGKPTIGRIGLKLSREGGDVVIEITDDGAGIDVETVRAKALERGLMAADAALTDDQVLDFVLAPGFSTARSVTQISGRGVGMDVVHSEVKQLGGSIDIGSVPGQGTSFTVRLPFTVSVNRALMVTLGEDQYAIPLNTIEGIVLIPSDELSQHYGPKGQPFEYAGVPYRVRYLGSYLGREYVARGEQNSVPVVLVRSGDQAVAVHVDDVQGSREIVVKSLGPQFAGVGGISGATILGDGSVVIILDLLSLMRAGGPGNNPDIRTPSSAEEERLVLVVDDSVTVRKVTSRLLERQGMSVMTAKDGVEAVSVLQERKPDIVLLDIEMPRMDGFEVARQIRRDERLSDLPIVMISSRTGDKHTERARELGVNRFLGKPFQENELLETIDELVKRS